MAKGLRWLMLGLLIPFGQRTHPGGREPKGIKSPVRLEVTPFGC